MQSKWFLIGVPALIIAISAGIGLATGLVGSIIVLVAGIGICWLTNGKAAFIGLPIAIGGIIAVFGGDIIRRL